MTTGNKSLPAACRSAHLGRACLLLGIFFILVSFLSCSGRYPKIHAVRHQWILWQQPDDAAPQETLAIALDVSDEDGNEDLEMVALVQDREELYWSIQKDQWTWKSYRGTNWLVSGGLLPPPGSPFPRGIYRVIVSDLAGYRVEQEITLSGVHPKVSFPRIKNREGVLYLSPGYGSTLLVIKSATGSVVGSFPLQPGDNPLQPIIASPTVRTGAKTLYLYSRSNDGEGPILITGPFDALEFLFPR